MRKLTRDHWTETSRELIYQRARAERRRLSGRDDFEFLRPEIAANYVLEEAIKYLEYEFEEEKNV